MFKILNTAYKQRFRIRQFSQLRIIVLFEINFYKIYSDQFIFLCNRYLLKIHDCRINKTFGTLLGKNCPCMKLLHRILHFLLVIFPPSKGTKLYKPFYNEGLIRLNAVLSFWILYGRVPAVSPFCSELRILIRKGLIFIQTLIDTLSFSVQLHSAMLERVS